MNIGFIGLGVMGFPMAGLYIKVSIMLLYSIGLQIK